jgi:sugar lactone lactonase YvrE
MRYENQTKIAMKIYLLIAVVMFAGCITNKPTTRIEFAAPDAYPEGIAYDKINDVFYVSSVTHATIGKVTPAGVYRVLHADSLLRSTYGMKVHPDGKRLFVCVSDATYSRHSTPDTKKKMVRLISIDLASGKRLSDVDLTALVPGKHFGNDLTFDAQDNVYMTDSYSNVIYRVTPDGTATVFSKSKLYETQGFGLNGIVFHPDGYLLVASSNKGRIFKVNITNPNDVAIVKIDQYLLGADGLILNDAKTLTVVVNGGNDKIFQFETTDQWTSAELAATTLAADVFTYPATATLKGNDIWVMNAKTTELQDSTGVPSKRFAIQQAVLKPLPK